MFPANYELTVQKRFVNFGYMYVGASLVRRACEVYTEDATVDPALERSICILAAYPLIDLMRQTSCGHLELTDKYTSSSLLALLKESYVRGLKFISTAPLLTYGLSFVFAYTLMSNLLLRGIIESSLARMVTVILYSDKLTATNFKQNIPNYILSGVLVALLNTHMKPYVEGFDHFDKYFITSIGRHFAKPVFENWNMHQMLPYLVLAVMSCTLWVQA